MLNRFSLATFIILTSRNNQRCLNKFALFLEKEGEFIIVVNQLLDQDFLATYNVDSGLGNVLDAAACEVVDNLCAILDNNIIN